MKIGIISPLYNEEDFIEDFFYQVKKVFNPNDLYFIDDSSTDNSAIVLNKIHRKENIITNVENKGQGNSILVGIKHLKDRGYDYVLTMDCDLQHEPIDINKFISHLKANPNTDVIVGSRYHSNSNEFGYQSPVRFLANQLFCNLFNELYGTNLTDCFSGYLLLNINTFDKITLTRTYAWIIDFWHFVLSNKMKVNEVTINRIYLDVPRDFKGQYQSKFEIVKDLLLVFEKNQRMDAKIYRDKVINHFIKNDKIYQSENIYSDQIIKYFNDK